MPRSNLAQSERALPFAINPELDRAAIREAYERDGRVRIFNLLSEGAVELYEHLNARTDWIHLITTDGERLELDPEEKAEISKRRWARIEAESHERVRRAFQYRYYGLRVPSPREEKKQTDLVTEFARLMRSEPMLDLLREVTGHDAVTFTDGQATAYDVGDFLTGHDDNVHGKNRLCAYVYGLTPYWRVEYGGILLFHGENDRTVEGQVPRFNTLDLFKVPRQHSVSMITPAAPHRRFTITGWLRGGSPKNVLRAAPKAANA